jgi:nitrate/TMAO reductase-like tetraheme cytochrome c subunit
MNLLIVLLVISVALLLPLLVRPSLTLRRAGKMFAFVAIVVLPATAGFAGLVEHMERSKTVAFCTSCHVMQPWGKSLHIDDLDHLAGKHFQYGRVPHETACFSCHTSYTLYGDYTAKLRGMRHVWVQYFGRVPAEIKLYEPYNNRECLHCHDGARSFEEAVSHHAEPGQLDGIRKNRVSCLTSGCHAVVHDAGKVDRFPAWPKESK